MNERWMIVHKRIMVGGLVASVATLPYSVKLCHTAMIIIIMSWLCEGSWRSKLITIRHSIFLQLIIALFLLQVVGLAFSDNVRMGWFSLEKRIFFVLLPVALATSLIKLEKRDLTLIFSAFIASCLAGTLVCLFGSWQETISPTGVNPSYSALPGDQSPYWLVFSYVGLADGIGIHPTYFSLYLAVCLLLVLDILPSLKTPRRKFAAVTLVLYLSVFIVLLSSRIIIAGMFIVFLLLVVRSVIQNRYSLGLVAIGALAVFVFMLLANPVTRYRSLKEINPATFDIEAGTHYKTAAQIRFSLWWIAMHSLTNSNPLIGFGTGDVNNSMAATGAFYGITNVIDSTDPHNQYLYTWMANGIPGLLVLVMCLYLPAWWAWTKGDFMTCSFVLLFCLVCTTESALELQKGIAFYALISGLLFFHKQSFQNISVNFRSWMRVGEQRL